jgi:hypothetical protein
MMKHKILTNSNMRKFKGQAGIEYLMYRTKGSMLRNSKAQAAMEYLMTSGWAMFVVFLVVSTFVLFGLLNFDRIIPDKVEISESNIQIFHSGTNKFIVKNIGGTTFYNLWFNFTSNDCIHTDKYTIRPDEIKEFLILCKDIPEKNKKFKSDFTANYQIKKLGNILSKVAHGRYHVTGNFFNTRSLVGYWNMDKIYSVATETFIEDVSWNNNKAEIKYYGNDGLGGSGELVNNPNITNGKINYALNFIDRDSLEIKNKDEFNIGRSNNKEFTISLWFKSFDTENNVGPIIIKSSGSGSINTDYAIYNSIGKIGFGTGNIIDNCAWLEVNTENSAGWHHVVAILKSEDSNSGKKSIYVDGKLIKSCKYFEKSDENNNDIYIGTNSRVNFFNGSIDEIMIFNRELSSNEVKALYESGW